MSSVTQVLLGLCVIAEITSASTGDRMQRQAVPVSQMAPSGRIAQCSNQARHHSASFSAWKLLSTDEILTNEIPCQAAETSGMSVKKRKCVSGQRVGSQIIQDPRMKGHLCSWLKRQLRTLDPRHTVISSAQVWQRTVFLCAELVGVKYLKKSFFSNFRKKFLCDESIFL